MYYTKQELIDAISELERGRHTVQNCEKMAAIYTVMDHMFPEEAVSGYSKDKEPERPGALKRFGDSDFLKALTGKDEKKAWELMDELMTALAVVDAKLHDSVMRKLKDI